MKSQQGLGSWFFTTDCRRIGWLYIATTTSLFALSGLCAFGLHLALISPAGEIVTPTAYERLFSLHGLMATFFFVIPSFIGTFGNLRFLNAIDAEKFAFPRLNLASLWIFASGGLLTLIAFTRGGTDVGWTLDLPSYAEHTGTSTLELGLGLAFVSFALNALNILMTFIKKRPVHPEMPVEAWGQVIAAVPLLLAAPAGVLALALKWIARVGAEVSPQVGNLDFATRLFSISAHHVLDLMIVPALALIIEIVQQASGRKPSRNALTIGALAMFAALRLIASGQGLGAALGPTLVNDSLALFAVVPFSLIVFNLMATLAGNRIRPKAPFFFALCALTLVAMGVFAKLALALPVLNSLLQGTSFATAQLHFLMAGGALTAYLAGLHGAWTSICGRGYNEKLACVSACVIFVGSWLAFLPQLAIGYAGMPQRHSAYPVEFQIAQIMSASGATVLGFGMLLPIAYLAASLVFGSNRKNVGAL